MDLRIYCPSGVCGNLDTGDRSSPSLINRDCPHYLITFAQNLPRILEPIVAVPVYPLPLPVIKLALQPAIGKD
ncbi:MAG: hypothetical protein Q7S86_03660, partial [bacterium]|nr:hypothetical protein [bacterium]